MAVCVRCEAKIGFLGGFITSQGRVCEKCRDIEKLSEKLKSILDLKEPVKIARALTPDAAADAAKLHELAPDEHLRVALAVRADPVTDPAALAALFRADADPKWAHALIDIGKADLAADLIGESKREIKDEWIEIIREIGKKRGLPLALGLSGMRTKAILDLVAEFAAPEAATEDRPLIKNWVASGRFLSVDELAAFLRAINASRDLRDAAKLSNAERLRLGLALGDDPATALESVTEPDSEILAIAERAGAAAFPWLERIAAPGPNAEKIVAIAAKIADKEAAFRIAVRCEEWSKAAELGDARAACVSRLGEIERESFAKIEKAIELISNGEFRQAHLMFAGIQSALVTATALDAVLACAELDTALRLEVDLEVVATRRKVRKGLADEGSVSRSIGTLRDTFITKCKKLLDADGHPFFALCGPAVKEKTHPDNREERFKEAAEAKDAKGITEAELIKPTIIAAFFSSFAALSQGKSIYERAMLYGILAKRLLDPLYPKAEKEERTGPKEVAVECAARALAFMPKVAVTSESRWSDFLFTFSGALRHLGYESAGIKRQREFRPSWITIEEPSLEQTDHLPPLDGQKRMTLDDFYKPPAELDLTRAKKMWEK